MQSCVIKAVGLLLAAMPALASGFIATTARADAMTGEEIRRDIIGRTIFLAAPITGEFPLNYRKSGVVDGDGAALGLGKIIRPNDTGKWSIDGNQLCQQFKTWYNGEKLCFVLTRLKANSVKWVRNNGETGIARIGD